MSAGPPDGGRRVLVVDDNADAADSLAMLLQVRGEVVRVAYDGEEALAAEDEFRPDVILLDIGMPKLNGYRACERIRGEAWGARPFIVALTGWGQDADKTRSKEAGFDRHLVKPVEPAMLEKLIRALPPSPGTRSH